MDYRNTVLFFMYLLLAKAACGPVREGRDTEAVNDTLQMMRDRIRNTLQQLAASPHVPSTPCLSQEITELVGDGQQNITANHLSSFSCHLLKMSELTQAKVTQHLLDISHLAGDLQRNQPPMENCSLPTFTEDTEHYVYVKCLLQTMDQRLSSATYDPSV